MFSTSTDDVVFILNAASHYMYHAMPPISYAESAFNSHDQIRLLTLLPPRTPLKKLDEGTFSITTLLESVNWADKPPYIALSYTWGNSSAREHPRQWPDG